VHSPSHHDVTCELDLSSKTALALTWMIIPARGFSLCMLRLAHNCKDVACGELPGRGKFAHEEHLSLVLDHIYSSHIG
jgi:hypothetical protein